MVYEFQIKFENRTCYGDHYIVWWWDGNNWHTVIDKIYYGTKTWIINTIKNEIKTMFGIKRAKWSKCDE